MSTLQNSSAVIISFLDDSSNLLEEVGDLSDNFHNATASHNEVETLFRVVHSLKGAVGFLTDQGTHFMLIQEFCHKLETLLDAIRKETIPINLTLSQLISEGLDTLLKDIEKIKENEEIKKHKTLLEAFEEAACPVVIASEENSQFILKPTKDLRTSKHINRFSKLIWWRLDRGDVGIEFVLNLDNKYMLSSMAIGILFDIVDKSEVKQIYIINAPEAMAHILERLQAAKSNILIRDSLESCSEQGNGKL